MSPEAQLAALRTVLEAVGGAVVAQLDAIAAGCPAALDLGKATSYGSRLLKNSRLISRHLGV